MNYMHCFIQMNEPPLWVWPTSSMIVMMSQWIMGVCSDLHFTNRCIVGSCSYVCVSERNPCALKTTWRRGHEDTQLRMLRNPLTLWNTPLKCLEVLLLRSAVNDSIIHPHRNRNLSALQDMIMNLWKVSANPGRPNGSSQIAVISFECDQTLSFLKSMQTHRVLCTASGVEPLKKKKKKKSISQSHLSPFPPSVQTTVN